MPRYITPQIRFANRGRAALQRMEQTAEKTIQVPSDHVTRASDFSGVIRRPRDFRRYLASNLFPPSITYANPSFILTAVSSRVDITGSNFASGTRVFLNGVEVISSVFVDQNHIWFMSPLGSSDAMEGPIDLFLLRPDTVGVHNSEVLRFENRPTISTLNPSGGFIEGGQLMHITGSRFKQGSTVQFGFTGASIASDNVTWLGAAYMDAYTPIIPDTMITQSGWKGITANVQVIGPSGLSTNPVPYQYSFHPPTASAISMRTGSSEGGDTILVTGSYFNPGSTVNVGGISVIPQRIDYTALTFLTPAHATGTVNVAVVNPDSSATLPISFEYVGASIPRVYSVISSFVSSIGTNIVTSGTIATVSGNNFTSSLDPLVQANIVFVGSASAQFSIVDRNRIVITTPSLTTGYYPLIISGPYGTGSLPNALRYVAPPTITDFNPKSGSVLGGTRIVVTGTNFLSSSAEMTVYMGAVTASWQISGSYLVVTTPPHAVSSSQITINSMGLVTGTTTSSFSWVTASSLVGPWYPEW